MEYLDKLRDSVKVKEILESDGPLSVSRIMNQYDKIINETAASNRDTSIDRPTQFHPLPVLNSLREVSSHMMAFQASPETPDGTACSSAMNAARQICYWSSLFMSMMDEGNVAHPTSTTAPSTSSSLSSSSSSVSVSSTLSSQPRLAASLLVPSSNVTTSPVHQDQLPYSSSHQHSSNSVINHQLPVSGSLQFEQNSLPFPTVSYNTSCTVSPSFSQQLSSSAPLSPSTISGQPLTVYSFCGQPALSSSSCVQSQFSLRPQPLPVTSWPIQVTPSLFQHAASFASERYPPDTRCQPPSSFACVPAVQSTLTSPILHPVALPTACPPASHQLPPCQPSSSSMSLLLSSTTVNQPPPGQSTMQPPPSSCMVVDPVTVGMHAKYGLPGQSCTEWLNTLKIPRNVESLIQVKEVWEVGGPNCPPLKDWTVLMRNYKSSKGQNTSVYSQRKFIYTLFQRQGFDINSILEEYNELKPGKLYKLLNTKQK